MKKMFTSTRSRLVLSHVALSTFSIVSLSSGFIYFIGKYFNDFLNKLQNVLDNNKGQIPKGQIISSLDIAHEYTHLMDIWVIIGAVLSVSAAVIIGVFMANRLSKPLMLFTKAIHRLKDSNYAQIQTPFTGELSELKEAYNGLSNNLQELQNIRKHLVENVSHELKTPLTALQGYIEGLEDGVIVFNKETAIEMGAEISRLKSLVNDFETSTLDYTAILQPVVVDVSDFFNELCNYFSPLIIGKELQIQVIHDREHYNVCFDPDRMKQVLIILVENSIKFTPRGGSISIAYHRENEQLCVSVLDTGYGIPYNDLPYIFERFYRGEKSRSRKTGGVGIGLSIAREIIHAHGGTIGVESHLGTGTKFTIMIPTSKKLPT